MIADCFGTMHLRKRLEMDYFGPVSVIYYIVELKKGAPAPKVTTELQQMDESKGDSC